MGRENQAEQMKKKRQKILLVSHEMTYTGAPRSLLNIARILKQSNADVDVWTLANGDFRREFENEQIPVSVLPEKIEEDTLRQYHLIILNTFFTAHLVGQFQKAARTILYIREAHNIPVLARECGLNTDHIRKADEVICISEYAGGIYQRKLYAPQTDSPA